MVKDAGDLAAGHVAGETWRDAAGGDYRHFRRFIFDELPEYLRDVAPPADRSRGAGVDLQKMFGESFRFSSEPEPGLELVDIVTNALRRGLIGNLGEAGWLPLRGLMIHRSDVYVSPVGLLPPDRKLARALLPVMSKFRAGGRIMATANLAWPENEAAIAKQTRKLAAESGKVAA